MDVLRYQIFNRHTREKVEDSSFAVVHKDWSHSTKMTYTSSLESHGATQKLLLVFSQWRFSVGNIIENRLGLLVMDEPNLVFILQFSPFEDEAAVAFHTELYSRRRLPMAPISDNELVSRACSVARELFLLSVSMREVYFLLFFRRELTSIKRTHD